MVPVVMGTSVEEYKKIAPPNSFIHVDNFRSPEELAKHLIYLNKNGTAYLEYHAWRRNYDVWKDTNRFCMLCEYFMKNDLQTIPKNKNNHILEHWNDTRMCKDPNIVYEDLLIDFIHT